MVELAILSSEEIRKVSKICYYILKSYRDAISKCREPRTSAYILKEFKNFCNEISNRNEYKIVENIVSQMENFGKAKISVDYDWFDKLKGVEF
jgi:hypothetical protein